MLHRSLISAALIAAAFTPATAFAASATQSGYDDNDEVAVQDERASGGAPESDNAPAQAAEQAEEAQPAPTVATSGSLPFTGAESGLIALAGLGLAATGVALHRAGRQPQA